ncbi:hypothetical protein MK805_16915 [Shimazuella sp. AN120528]|uniref:hypothetical protein n=1 Tax=Shimazuella soli TaxID=1892854 RepID=UPI001F0FB2EB|nr:hypothetical protein [Shimazuella soli]MCH5586619.1 hypothetical protein [Shimazuella soli]
MNQKRWLVNSLLMTMFLLAACSSNSLNGWEKPENLKEFEQAAKKELTKQYKESFVIKSSKKECIALTEQEEKECNRELFTAEASPQSNPSIVFTVDYHRSYGGSFDNNYLEQYMDYDLQQLVQSRLKIKNMILQVNVSYHSTDNNLVSYIGSVKDYQKILKKIPSHTSVYVYLLDGKQSLDQKAEQIYQISHIPQLQTLVTNYTVNYYANLPQNHRNPYSQNPLSSFSFTMKDLESVQSIKEKLKISNGYINS